MINESKENLAEYWKSITSLKKNSGTQSASFWNNRAEGYSRKGNNRDKKISEVIDMVRSVNIDINGAEILDIGAGPGTLAIPLARMGAKVTAIDISEQMLKRLEKKAYEEDLPVKTILSSWSDIDLDVSEFRGRFDIVIASMTPAISSPETFNKMMEASQNICFYSNFVNRKWDVAYDELYRMLFCENFKELWLGFHIPFMLLYTIGYRPIIKIDKDKWERDETIDDMVESVSGFFSNSRDIDDGMKSRMRKYFEERTVDGIYHSTSDVIKGMMMWEIKIDKI